MCYVDNILCISQNPVIFLGRIQGVFKFKGNNIEQSKIYHGDHFVKMIVDGAAGWYMSEEKYVRPSVENVEQKIEKIQSAPTHRLQDPHVWLLARK